MEKSKAYRIGVEYGLSEESYYEMFDNQEGKCAICGTNLDNPHIDHDHITGKVRGLLCPACNWGLGQFADNPAILRKAATYITDSRLHVEIDNSMYEMSEESSRKVPDWRKQSFTPEQKKQMAEWTPDQMRTYASESGMTYKTLSNWRLRSRSELGIEENDTESN